MEKLQFEWGKMAFSDSVGTGRPLLFLHGTGCDSRDWNKVTEQLPGELRIICVDFRGHGKSDVCTLNFCLNDLAEDVEKLLEQLDLKNVILVGHSLGGMVAIRIADNSDRINGLVLLEGWTDLKVMSKTFESEHFYGNLNQEQIEQISSKYVETIKRFSEDVWKKFWSSVDDFNGFQILQNLKIPIWEIYGNCGLRTDDYNNSLLIPKSPYIKLEWIPDAGHFLPHEKPVETATFCQKL